MMRSGSFDAPDGTRLHADWFPAEGPARATLVIAHGYDDHAGRYAEVARTVARAGFAAMTFDYRGHGRAGGRRGHCHRFDEFLGDLERAIAHAAKEHPDKPIGIVAHSHGALISLRALTDPQRQPKVFGAVLSSPFLGLAMKVSPVKLLAGRIASRIAPTLTLKSEIDAAKISHDPATIAARRTDTLCHGVATARWFTEATAAQDYVATHASRVRVPTLWLVAGGDEIADPKAARRVYDRLGGDKTIHVYEGYHHEVFNEVGRETVLSTLVDWLSAKVPSA